MRFSKKEKDFLNKINIQIFKGYDLQRKLDLITFSDNWKENIERSVKLCEYWNESNIKLIEKYLSPEITNKEYQGCYPYAEYVVVLNARPAERNFILKHEWLKNANLNRIRELTKIKQNYRSLFYRSKNRKNIISIFLSKQKDKIGSIGVIFGILVGLIHLILYILKE